MNDQLRTFLQLGDAVIITDDQHQILEINTSYEAITGYNRREILGKTAGIVRTSLTPVHIHESMKEALKAKRPWSGVFINRRKDGQLWHSSITITPLCVDESWYYIGIFRELEQLPSGFYMPQERIGHIQSSLLKVLAISCEIRDPGIESHLVRVRALTEELVRYHNERMQLGWNEERLSRIASASILHDIGKSGIPEGILYKPGPLADYERTIIEMHTFIGVDIIEKIFNEFNDELFTSELTASKHIILHHHERWDGKGYPHKLAGEAIPIEARIVSIVDVFDALTSKRPYKEKWSEEQALAYIKEMRGTQFDPDLVDSFIQLYGQGETAVAAF
ncbi:histidine kinase [Paenibacillus sp. BIHB 4019]|uniref:Histidine kinase n=1 Tax=Paenibacillus sp. BIHB 4019 TaxID=1870819 RepID=A0A1B2DJY0_9BACL|nr:HD-GYP domain-containing protein [Paenibacillus sp. BIHB 4019]ANY67991.1 histidine kinase [Paenibacillus sp. BIHB 4019]